MTAPRPAALFAVPKAVTASATVFLLVASASLSAIAYTVVSTKLRNAGLTEPPAQQAAMPQMATPIVIPGFAPISTAASPEARAVEEIWGDAERLAAAGGGVTLVRATLPRNVAESALEGGAVRVVHEPRKGTSGLRVVDVDEPSAAALAGVRRGDVITMVNGFPMNTPEDGKRAFASVRAARALVADVWREGRRMVLRVDWGS
ncbi:MAG: PDZ domain-containing protein [Minicystis sp.]